MFLATLIILQFVPLPFEATKEPQKAIQGSELTLASDKPPSADTRLYQDILITQEDIKQMLTEQFTTYGIADQIPMAERVIACESSWNINADNGISYGLFQFTPATWHEFGYGDIMNPQSQIIVAAKMVKAGLWNRWDCFKKLST